MDSDSLLFQGAIDALPTTLNVTSSIPGHCPVAMPVQTITPWTPSRLLAAGIAWLMEETPMPPPVRARANSHA